MSAASLLAVYNGQEPELCFGGAPGPGGVNSVGVGLGLAQTGTSANPQVSLGMSAVGDLLVGTGAPTSGAVLPKGANGTFLRVKTDGSGLEYVAVVPGGGVNSVSAAANNVGYVNNSNPGPDTPQIGIAFAAVGDLPVGTGANTGTILQKGANGNFLRVKTDGSGLEYAAVAPGGVDSVSVLANNPLVVSTTAPASATDPKIGIAFAAKGDLVVGTGVNTGVILTAPLGPDLVLTSAPGEASGLKWEAQGSGSAPIINRNNSNITPLTIAPPATANDTMILITQDVPAWEWDNTQGFLDNNADVIGFTSGASTQPATPTHEYTGTIAEVGYVYNPLQPPISANATLIKATSAPTNWAVYWKFDNPDPGGAPFILSDPARISGFQFFKHSPGDERPEMYVYGSFNRIAPIVAGFIDVANEKICYCLAIINDFDYTISNLVDINGIKGVSYTDPNTPQSAAYISAVGVNFYENSGLTQAYITFVGFFNCYITGAEIPGAAGEVQNVSQFFINDILAAQSNYEFKTTAFLQSENIGIPLAAGDFLTCVYQLQPQGSDFQFFIGGKFSQVGYAAPFLPMSNFLFMGNPGTYLPIAGSAITSPIFGVGASLTPDYLCIYGSSPVFTAYVDIAGCQVNPPTAPGPANCIAFTLPGNLTGLVASYGGFCQFVLQTTPPAASPTANYDIIALQTANTTIYWRNPNGANIPAWNDSLGINPSRNVGLNGGTGFVVGIPPSLGTYSLVANYTTNPGTTTFRQVVGVNPSAQFVLSSGKFKYGGTQANYDPGYTKATLTQFASQSFVASSPAADWVAIGAINPEVSFQV